MKALLLNIANTYVGPRTPVSLNKAGFSTALVAPASSIFHHSSHLQQRCILKPQVVEKTLAYSPHRVISAIRDWRPDMILPQDLAAYRMLSHICRNGISDSEGQYDHIKRIQSSLGDIALHDQAEIHSALHNALEILGLPRLQQCTVKTFEDVTNFAEKLGWPLILKNSVSVNGQGVYYCESKPAFESIYNAIPQSKRNNLIVQQYCDGDVIRHSIASYQGEVVGSVTGIQLHTRDNNPTSVATALRITHIPEIEVITSQLAKHWSLGGFSGFDFLHDKKAESYYLIDHNKQINAFSNLGVFAGQDLFQALYEKLKGGAVKVVKNQSKYNPVVTLFPYEWLRDPDSPHLKTSASDAPTDDPTLYQEFLKRLKINPAKTKIL